MISKREMPEAIADPNVFGRILTGLGCKPASQENKKTPECGDGNKRNPGDLKCLAQVL